MSTSDQLPAVSADFATAEFDDALVVYEPTQRVVHRLELAAAIVFDACREGVPRTALVEEFSEGLGLSTDQAEAEIETLLGLLDSSGLFGTPVEGDEGPECVGCTDSGVRRLSSGRNLRRPWHVPRARRRRRAEGS